MILCFVCATTKYLFRANTVVMPAQDLSSQLMPELIKSIDKVGVQRTFKALKNVQNEQSNNDHIEDFIVQSCCTHYGIKDRYELIHGKTRKDGDRTSAMTICFVLMEEHLLYGHTEIAQMMGKHRSVVSRYVKWFRRLNPQLKTDIDTLHDYNTLKDIIKEFIEKNK